LANSYLGPGFKDNVESNFNINKSPP
jgi:hypothetical protein